ncbi:hypothetical protein E0H47_31655 [Rhizobium leguminosarum bv. viciae]|uniref:hypothetical protein n=1 Tax=Rhizobium leguminosarum TaxID=384 RepID=UPI00103D6D10|nr:hypothetical protein [Rhizobium leguminosarum]TBZ30960.1 hypothetical protein E0H47_31655 [Rhizobium leguminosarum bv. viciae]
MRARLLGVVALLMIVGCGPAGAIPSVGSLLYPEQEINQNIDHLEAAIRRLIEQAGSTVDASILKALQSMLAGVQSARNVYGDALDQTMKQVGDQRAALLYDLAGQIVEMQKFADKQVNTFSEAEQRFNNTITEAARAPKLPFVISVEPQLYRPERVTPVHVMINGQHLSDERNVLRVGGTDYKPLVNQPNRLEFNIDRSKLKPDERGFASFDLVANRVDQSFWSFLPWREDPAPITYHLAIRSAAPTLASFRVETAITKPGGYRSPDPVVWSATNPDNEEHCVARSDEEEFDPGYSRLEIVRNDIYTPEVLVLQFTLEKKSPGTVPGPANAAVLTTSTPEKLCVRLHSPASLVYPGKQTIPERAMRNGHVTARVYYRIKKTIPDVVQWTSGGIVNWDKDEPVELPAGYGGFRATVNFTDAERDVARVFTVPQSYGPLTITFDAQTRTLVFRPNQVD